MHVNGSQTNWDEPDDVERTSQIDGTVDLDSHRADWQHLPRASITEIGIDPGPDPEEHAGFLNALTIDNSAESEPEAWIEAMGARASSWDQEAPMSPIVEINGVTYLQIDDDPNDNSELVWARINDYGFEAQTIGYLSLYNDYSGSGVSSVSCGRTANGGLMVSESSDEEIVMYALPAGYSAATIINALAGSSIGQLVDVGSMVDSLLASGDTEFHKPEEEGDEWIDSVQVTLSLDETLLEELRQQ